MTTPEDADQPADGEPTGWAPPPPPPPPPGGLGGPHAYEFGGVVLPPPPPVGVPRLASVLRVVFGVSVALLVFTAFREFHYAAAVDDYAAGRIDYDSVLDLENQLGGLDALYLLVLVVCAVVFVVWQSRIRRTAEAFGARDFRRSTRMGVGGWFIPFVNLVVPKREMDDLWRAGDPDAGRVFSITGKPVSGLLNAWWACWIGANLLSPRVFGAETTLGEIAGNARRAGYADLATAVAAMLALLVVTQMTARHVERARRQGVELS